MTTLDTPPLDLSQDVTTLLARLVDIESVSGNERRIADAVEAAVQPLEHLEVLRDGHAVLARTRLDRAERVVIAGHLDTVPVAGNLPSRREGDVLYGLGSCDMKGGIAVMLRLAQTVPAPTRDVTYVWYDCEEVERVRNGLSRIADEHPEWLSADFAVLMEPSQAGVEAGCQGSLRLDVTVHGRRAHSARSWLGGNAIHEAARVLERLVAYEPRQADIDGLVYCEGLNAVGISGGVAGNVIPDVCTVSVNYRFAPDRSLVDAEAHVRRVFEGFDVHVVDASPGALPGLSRPAAGEFVSAVGGRPAPKFGWTDVALFSQLGVPAVNYGPGDPGLAHTREEHVSLAQVVACEDRLRTWLTG